MADNNKTHVDASKLGKGARTVKHNGSTYRISKPTNSSRDGKKYSVQVEKVSDGKVVQKKTVHWGAKGYQDYKVHKDDKRRDNFQARHKAIKKKDGSLAHKDPLSPSFYSTKYNWSHTEKNIVSFSYMIPLENNNCQIFSNVSLNSIKFMN